MLSVKNYVKVSSIDEAYELNQKKANRIMGGLMWLRLTNAKIDTLIDLSNLGLNTITETDDEIIIGAMTTLRALETNELLNSYSNNAVRDAVKDIVGVQFRNGATIGGSLYGRYGFSDVLTVFLAMDTYVELYKGGLVTLAEYSTMPRDNDILVRVIVKKQPIKMSYQAMRIQRTDFPVLTCCASKTDSFTRVVIGARPGRAVTVDVTGIPTDEIPDKVASSIKTESNLRGSARYRKHLASVLTTRALDIIKEDK